MSSRSVARGSIIPLATLLLLSLVAAGPSWGPGLLNTRGGGDSPFLLQRTHQLVANLRAGIIPARWMPDAAFGFGYPFFSYYSALPYYLAAGFALIGLDILSAIKLTQTLLFTGAALGMYGWARRTLRSQVGGWLAAVGYTLAPYHLVNVYVRGDSLSEFAASAFYPLILWGLDHLTTRPSLRRTIPAALAYAGLITTHNLSALSFSPFALLYLAILTWHRENQRWRALGYGLCCLAIGVLLSAWYWLPALGEASYGQLAAQTSGYFHYSNHFRGMDLVQPSIIFDYSVAPDAPASFAAMGLVQAITALGGVLALIVLCVRRRNTHDPKNPVSRAGLGVFALVGITLTTWLMTPLSRPVWDHLPLLPMMQFPWRLLSVQALFTALLAGVLVVPFRRYAWAATVILAALLAVGGLVGLRPEYLPVTAQDVTVDRLQLYELFTGNIGSTIRHEYLPRWVVPRPYTGPLLFDPEAQPRIIPLTEGVVTAEEITHEPTRRTWRVEADPGDTKVALPIYYWPGWRATLDGRPVEVKAAPDSGYLTLTIPRGQHVIEVWLGRTGLRAAAEAISVAAALAVVALALVAQLPVSRALSALQPSILRLRPFLPCFLAFGLALAALAIAGPRLTSTEGSALTMDFHRMPYLHHNPGGVELGGWRMMSYRYGTDRIAAGSAPWVTLDYEAWQEGITATLQLVSPAAVRQGELPPLAETTANIAPTADSTALDLSIPQDIGPGLHLIRLSSGAQQVYLRPVWVGEDPAPVDHAGGTEFVDGALRLLWIEATQVASDRLNVRLDWSAVKPVAANYGISLRLTDTAGNEWARLDPQQPGYGFLPTGLWSAGRLVHDHYTLPLPVGTPPGDSYTLEVILYRVATGESVGEGDCQISLDQATIQRDAPIAARFGDELALSDLDAPEHLHQGETLPMTAYWLAVEQPSADYVVEWQLEGAEEIVSATLPLAPGSPPTTWPVGAWVAGRAALRLPPTIPSGHYVLSIAVHDPITGTLLGTYASPRTVRIEERKRVWEAPPLDHVVGARFGGMIELIGYDLERSDTSLKMTLHWRALAVPDQHYTFFLHVADPATGHPVAQVDAMPRQFTYPTGMWASGEVVSDEVVLSLEGVSSGSYELAIGWYNPQTRIRLAAQDRAGNPLPDDRLILNDKITLLP